MYAASSGSLAASEIWDTYLLFSFSSLLTGSCEGSDLILDRGSLLEERKFELCNCLERDPLSITDFTRDLIEPCLSGAVFRNYFPKCLRSGCGYCEELG